MFFDLNDMPYTVQYWNERAAEWRGTGAGTIFDRDAARQRMRAFDRPAHKPR